MKKFFTKSKLNNSGAALVTVIIVIAFLSVLVTTVLYVTGVNYYAKSTDRMTKRSFYEAETALEKVRAELMLLAKEAHIYAYEQVIVQSASKSETEMKAEYNKLFVDKLEEIMKAKCAYDATAGYTNYKTYFDYHVGTQYVGGFTLTTSAPEYDVANGKMYVRGFNINYYKDGYQTYIGTDFCVKAPEITWTNDTNPIDFTGASASDLERKKIDMSDCVMYINWEKR